MDATAAAGCSIAADRTVRDHQGTVIADAAALLMACDIPAKRAVEPLPPSPLNTAK